ncbi:hypothetical protein CcCBS67573_g08681 [Chytriomyces confervae]|uniref:Uncharacterized protein n=1 Tax=Chytriomyces confervae TaxID=246404 RepID=A0A507EJS7_9FUNG|nr:hypothetical protein CcCBS67573_g08681 [Chytriomyces confervae]
MKDTMRDEDPREAILKHADAASSDPFWIAPAYQKTQPKTVMADNVYEDENEEDRASKKKSARIEYFCFLFTISNPK